MWDVFYSIQANVGESQKLTWKYCPVSIVFVSDKDVKYTG